MNFEERDSHWERFLQDKANISQSFSKDSCCKICLCLELLKVSVCSDSCYRPQEESELVDRLLSGILDPDTFSVITDKLNLHFKNIVFVSGFQEKLAELEQSLKKHTQKMIDLDISSHLEKLNKVDRSVDLGKLDILVQRIDNYEETLIQLRKENEELRIQLNKAVGIHEEYIQANRKSANEIKSEFEFLREEQNKIKSTIEGITKSVQENASTLKEIKTLKENYKDDGEIKAMRLQLIEEQKGFIEKAQDTFRRIEQTGGKSEKKLDKAWEQIQGLKKDFDAIQVWQKECITLSRHSSHLLSASDSVYSSMQQLQDFNNVIENKLDMIQKEIELRLPEKKNMVIEEFYHTGLYNYDEEQHKFCWTCCKANQDAKGCQRKFKINEM